MTTDQNINAIKARTEWLNQRHFLTLALEQPTIKTLTMTEPWASLVAAGAKKQETRTWHPYYTGTIAIQSAKGFTWQDEEQCDRKHFKEALEAAGYRREEGRSKNKWNLPLGCIIAIAYLSDSYQLSPLVFQRDLPPEPERSFGNYSGGRHIWLFSRVHRLKTPIPVRGYQGLWHWTPPESFRKEIRAELAKLELQEPAL